MMQDPTRQYRKVQVATAAQDDLLILLLDRRLELREVETSREDTHALPAACRDGSVGMW